MDTETYTKILDGALVYAFSQFEGEKSHIKNRENQTQNVDAFAKRQCALAAIYRIASDEVGATLLKSHMIQKFMDNISDSEFIFKSLVATTAGAQLLKKEKVIETFLKGLANSEETHRYGCTHALAHLTTTEMGIALFTTQDLSIMEIYLVLEPEPEVLNGLVDAFKNICSSAKGRETLPADSQFFFDLIVDHHPGTMEIVDVLRPHTGKPRVKNTKLDA